VNNELERIGRKRHQTIQVLFQQFYGTTGKITKDIFYVSVRRFDPLHQSVPSVLPYKTRKVGKTEFLCQERGLNASWDVST
jgi:hypothetical protein